jgi:hypothetical protein
MRILLVGERALPACNLPFHRCAAAGSNVLGFGQLAHRRSRPRRPANPLANGAPASNTGPQQRPASRSCLSPRPRTWHAGRMSRAAVLFAVLCIALGVCSARKMDADLLLPSYDDLAEVVAAEVVKAAGSGRQLLSKPDMGRLAAVTAKRIACEPRPQWSARIARLGPCATRPGLQAGHARSPARS